MLVATKWKSRPMSPDDLSRMMETWGKLEADLATHPDVERLCWYAHADGTGGFTVSRVTDTDGAMAFYNEIIASMTEFIEVETELVIEMDTVMEVVPKLMERVGAS